MSALTLCMLNSQYIHAAPTPWCLKKGVETFSRVEHTVRIAEGTVNEQEETLFARLTETPAEVYGFCCYIWNITQVQALAAALRRTQPAARIVFGGPEASFRARALLEAGCADGVICGEGEQPLAMLMDAVAEGRPLTGIPGVWCCEQGMVREGGVFLSSELPPPPDDSAYIEQLHGRIAYLETSRGCPFSCAFCLSGREESVRFRPLEETKRRLVALANSGCRTIKLIDRTFNCNPARTDALIAFLIAENGQSFPRGVCFHFEVAADLFREETLRRLEQAPVGLFQLEAGIQSFHADTLAAVSRKTDTDRLYAILHRLIASRRMHIHVDLIAGLPYEDAQRFGESFDRAYSLQPQMLQLGFLKLLYGSRLRAQAAEFGFVCEAQPPYEIRATRWMDAAALERLHNTADALDRIYNSGRFRLTAAYLLRATGWTPFALYDAVGAFTGGRTAGIALRDYAAELWTFGQTCAGVKPDALRSALVCDWLASVRGGKLPQVLRVPDRRLKPAAEAARAQTGIPPDAFAAALLYDFAPTEVSPAGMWLVCADYRTVDPVSGRFPLHFQHIKNAETIA